MNTPQFCALPVELIVKILAELDLQDLLSCSETCRFLHHTIKHAVILQYNMQLAIAGLEDCGSASRLPVAERLAEVLVHEEGWANLRFRGRHSFPVPQNCRVWELCGGVISHGLPTELVPRGLAFIEFPSISRGIPARTWEHPDLGVNIRDFAFDPIQDLVVIIAAKPRDSALEETWDREIHLLAMSSGKNHPEAASVPLVCSLNRATDKDGDFVIQIMTNYVAILFHARDVDCKDQLFILDWKTGKLITNHMFPGMNQMDGFSFLSPRHFLVSKIEPTPLATDPPELQVYDFLDTDPEQPMTPRLVRSFLLPQPVDGAIVAAMTVRSDPAPRDSSPTSHLEGAPFRSVSSSSNILVISIVIFHPRPLADGDFIRDSFQLFVNTSTLLNDIPRANRTTTEAIIPWDLWGPTNSRMLIRTSMEFTWVCYVHGTRYATLDRRGLEPRRSRLRMLDFNPLLVRKAQHTASLDAETDVQRPGLEQVGGITCEDPPPKALKSSECRIISASQPTVIRGGQGFKDDVETSLPYRDISSSEVFDYKAVMIDEECLVGIHAPLTDGLRVFEVLCF